MKVNIAIMENLNAIRIGDFAYSDDLATVLWADKDITSLDGMERGVRCIGEGAFSGCEKLRVVRIPETVIRIEDFAFRDCTNIQELHLPYYMEYISPLAFTQSGRQNEFYLPIPKVLIPKDADAFRKYAFLLPQYISWFDSEEYGVTDDELEEDGILDEIEGYPIIIDVDEELRMFVKYSVQDCTIVSADLVCKDKVAESDEAEIIQKAWEYTMSKCSFLQCDELVRAEDYPFISQIDESFCSFLEQTIRNSYLFGWDNRPIANLVYALQENLKIGFILPVTGDSLEWEGKELYDYGMGSYGDVVGRFEDDIVWQDSSLESWYERMELDCEGLLMLQVMEYQKRGYAMSVPMMKRVFLVCMRMVFHIGLSYGLKYKRLH